MNITITIDGTSYEVPLVVSHRKGNYTGFKMPADTDIGGFRTPKNPHVLFGKVGTAPTTAVNVVKVGKSKAAKTPTTAAAAPSLADQIAAAVAAALANVGK